MTVRQPSILLNRDYEQIAAAVEQLHSLLPTIDVCWLVEQHPQTLLDSDTFAETVAEARRMIPDLDIPSALHRNPSFIFGFERRSSMIPYDS